MQNATIISFRFAQANKTAKAPNVFRHWINHFMSISERKLEKNIFYDRNAATDI